MRQDRIGVLGVGYAVPPHVRTNEDPIFDYLHEHAPPGMDLFRGYEDRHVLGPGETVTGLLFEAAEKAIAHAGCAAADIRLLLGYVSVSDYRNPNALGALHAHLKLDESALILPINNEFNNFNTGLTIARALLAGQATGRALIVCAGNWTRHVDYTTPQSLSAADGAGAAIVGYTDDAARFAIVDSETVVRAQNFGAMYMVGDAVQTAPDCDTDPKNCTWTTPWFHITAAGVREYQEFGIKAPPLAVNRLLERHKLRGSDIALITHQSSAVLLEAWQAAIGPGQYIETLKRFANMTVANLPVNLAWGYDAIEQDHLVLCGIGVEGQTQAVLLQRH